MIADIRGNVKLEVALAYTDLFNQIHSYPEPLASAWWSGAYRTLDHFTADEQLAAIKQYSDMAARAYQRYIERTAHNGK